VRRNKQLCVEGGGGPSCMGREARGKVMKGNFADSAMIIKGGRGNAYVDPGGSGQEYCRYNKGGAATKRGKEGVQKRTDCERE